MVAPFVLGETISSPNAILGFITMLVIIPLCILVTILIFWKRGEPIFRQRFYPMLLVEQIGGMIAAVLFCLDLFTFPYSDCSLAIWNSMAFFPLSSLPVLIRAWVYVIRYRLTQGRRNTSADPSLMLKYVRFIRPSFLWKFWAVCFFFLLAIPFVANIIWTQEEGADMLYIICPWSETVTNMIYALGAITIMLWIVTCVFLWKAQDVYKIKQEMFFYLLAWIWGLGMFGVGIVTTPYVTSSLYIAMTVFANFAFYTWLLILSSIHYKVEADLTFEGCMSNSSFRRRFADYLALQLCVENILFWEDVQAFKTCSDADVPSMSRRIYEKYIVTDSLYQINISAICQREIRENMLGKGGGGGGGRLSKGDLELSDYGSPDPSIPSSPLANPRDVFNGAEAEVISMMKFHSWPMFMCSLNNTSLSAVTSATNSSGSSGGEGGRGGEGGGGDGDGGGASGSGLESASIEIIAGLS
eukprot:TRINITY_DN2075_c0_g1_i6.p1 TRINITY_DN2075_c0_g1~~TRINITY_DN2075_c0_g1_i6.p1  ORF type:complete len:470 (+),score=58.72 TRINITY_DN2075_c0_g1_i6:28-1437(+)